MKAGIRQTYQLRFDLLILFATRILRMFAYGLLAVMLALYLSELGFSEAAIGMLLTLTLLGDTLVSLWITTHADRLGRRRMLIAGSLLMLLAGLVFLSTHSYYFLLASAIIGVISPSGYEVGPFLPIEQASLSQLVEDKRRTQVFAWYNLVGSFATALGALSGGLLSQGLQDSGYAPLASYQAILLVYCGVGLLMGLFFSQLTPAIEVPASDRPVNDRRRSLFGLHKSRSTVFRLAGFFSLDAFAGGFVVQSLLAYWFYLRFAVEPGALGAIFFAANLLAGISALSAAWVAAKIGLVNTMVFTHLPSNILLILVPFMPNLPAAVALLLLRFSISQMDVPTRQSFTMAVVAPDERSAAAGVTGVARTVGAALSPSLTGVLISNPALLGVPFVLSGSLKIIYDLLLYFSFRSLKPPEETGLMNSSAQDER